MKDVLPPQKENNDDGRNCEDDNEEDYTTPNKKETQEEEMKADDGLTQTEHHKEDTEEDAIPPENDTEDMSEDGENTDEEHITTRDIRPKRYRKIKYKLIGEEDTHIGIVVGKGKNNGKYREKIWIKTDNNTEIYDINTDLESWKYAEVVFTKGTKQADKDKEIQKKKI